MPSRPPVLPLRDVVVFPYVAMPLLVGRQASLGAIEAAAAEGGLLFLVAQRSADTEEPAAGDLHRVGVIARIVQATRQANGTARILVEGVSRARVTRYVPASGLPARRARRRADTPSRTIRRTLNVVARRVLALFEEYVALHRRIPNEVIALVQGADSVERQAYGIAAHLAVRVETRQTLLEAPNVPAAPRCAEPGARRARSSCSASSASSTRKCAARSSRTSASSICRSSSRRSIASSGRTRATTSVELERLIEARKLPDAGASARAARSAQAASHVAALARVDRRAQFRRLDSRRCRGPSAPTTCSTSPHARRVLDEDHYGLEEVKDRILDYIGVLSLVERMEGPILCLVGPPGVGKTSLGRSIARALGRKFVRMSLGGVRDEAEIRGHRRTYIGSMPGRVIQAMRRAEVVNPVILLDEIDKLGHDYRGDPSAALLEVLDPEQNRAFNDHYLEVDYDLSQVLFVTTANYLPQVPGAAARSHGDHSARRLSRSGEVRHRAAVPRAEAAAAERARSGHVEWDTDAIPVDRSRVHARGRRA